VALSVYDGEGEWMADNERSRALRRARGRALERLRQAHEDEYQTYVDDELVRAGDQPRQARVVWTPKGTRE
jgi:hypothetical protein